MDKIEGRKFQGLVGDVSFSIILPKDYAVNLGIAKGDFVKVSQEEGKIIVEKDKGVQSP
jgi:formylmethanofuran dehydrogenase subunit D